MSELKSIYQFNDDEQYLKIEFENQHSNLNWSVLVFDENWSDLISTAAGLSELMAESVAYAYEALGIRGRIAIMVGLKQDALAEMIETSLFHLQALLFSSAVVSLEGMSSLESYGFTTVNLENGQDIFILSSNEGGSDACRFL
ncbi:hypothetical protein [Mesobacillus subterraneus]|uniref:Uncharacterized protein n=1 Tax=Mesobacillus subterraneus TaxID=285983 RepID=A0A3R9FVM5_9BACI|nr:hypothetical protein [Mesobacillus subterraneus]RSD26136.1 hypothetical protein EJA10_15030 [Mesobacillus subterraneus]